MHVVVRETNNRGFDGKKTEAPLPVRLAMGNTENV